MNSIIIRNLSKTFEDRTVLNNISITIPRPSRIAFTAPSGYGKTTLIRIILGLEKPDSGEVYIDDCKFSVVFQEDRLSEEFSVYTNVKFAKSQSVDKSFILQVLDALGLKDVVKKPVKKLSGGMKRRVALARALCSDFDTLILDEPFKGLDNDLKDEIINYLDYFCEDKTVILVTHDISDAQKLNCEIIDLTSLNNS